MLKMKSNDYTNPGKQFEVIISINSYLTYVRDEFQCFWSKDDLQSSFSMYVFYGHPAICRTPLVRVPIMFFPESSRQYMYFEPPCGVNRFQASFNVECPIQGNSILLSYVRISIETLPHMTRRCFIYMSKNEKTDEGEWKIPLSHYRIMSAYFT